MVPVKTFAQAYKFYLALQILLITIIFNRKIEEKCINSLGIVTRNRTFKFGAFVWNFFQYNSFQRFKVKMETGWSWTTPVLSSKVSKWTIRGLTQPSFFPCAAPRTWEDDSKVSKVKCDLCLETRVGLEPINTFHTYSLSLSLIFSFSSEWTDNTFNLSSYKSLWRNSRLLSRLLSQFGLLYFQSQNYKIERRNATNRNK